MLGDTGWLKSGTGSTYNIRKKVYMSQAFFYLFLFKIKLDLYTILCVYLGMKCDKCKKIKADIEYHGGHYCTWYCAKKKN